MSRFFGGLDWGGTRHAVCILDEHGKVVLEFEVDHGREGLAVLDRRLGEIERAGELRIAIERPSGVLVDSLLAAGHVVVPIHPNVVKACRPRYRAAGGKNDRGDAYVLADILRTDGHRFRSLVPQSDAIKALRALVRTRDDLVVQRVALANRLRALLESFWPAAAIVFPEIDSRIALAFVLRFPTPQTAEKLNEKRLAVFLARNSYSGRTPAKE